MSKREIGDEGFWLGYVKVEPLLGSITLPDGAAQPLQRKPMEVLVALARRAGEVVPREVLLDAVWGPDRGADEGLKRCIFQLRQVLGDDRHAPRYIETIHGRGYRCVARVTPFPPSSARHGDSPAATAGGRPADAAAAGEPPGAARPEGVREAPAQPPWADSVARASAPEGMAQAPGSVADAGMQTRPSLGAGDDGALLLPFTDDPVSDAVLSRQRRARLLGQHGDRDAAPRPRWRALLRVAGIYIVVTAFILQFASVALPVLLVPDWVLTLVVVIAGAGFPVAIATANWLLGSQRERKPVHQAVDGMVLAALVLLGVFVYLRAADEFMPADGRQQAAASAGGIAVLPFSTPGLIEDAYLGEGLPDAIISGLSNIPGLRVPPVSSTFGLTQADSANVATVLGVRHVLEGSIRRAADGFVIALRIWDAVDRQPRLSWTLERPREDIFGAINTIVLEVARVISDDIDPNLLATAVTSQRTTSDEDAYLAYLEGRTLWKRRDETSVREAIRQFDRAVALDRGFARAYASLASAWLLLGIYGLEPEANASREAEHFAEQALAYGADIGEAYAVLGMLKLLRWDWLGAEQGFQRAIAAEPNEPLTHHWYSTFLGEVGRLDASLVQARQLHELDPLSPAVSNRMAWAHLGLGRYEDARSWSRRAREAGIRQEFFFGYLQYLIELNSSSPGLGVVEFRRTLAEAGLDDTWLDPFASALRDDADAATVARAVRALRDAHDLEDVAERQRLLFLSVLLPDPALALEVLEHMQQHGRGLLGVTLWLPDAAALRRSDAFADLMSRIGLTEYWDRRDCSYSDGQYHCNSPAATVNLSRPGGRLDSP